MQWRYLRGSCGSCVRSKVCMWSPFPLKCCGMCDWLQPPLPFSEQTLSNHQPSDAHHKYCLGQDGAGKHEFEERQKNQLVQHNRNGALASLMEMAPLTGGEWRWDGKAPASSANSSFFGACEAHGILDGQDVLSYPIFFGFTLDPSVARLYCSWSKHISNAICSFLINLFLRSQNNLTLMSRTRWGIFALLILDVTRFLPVGFWHRHLMGFFYRLCHLSFLLIRLFPLLALDLLAESVCVPVGLHLTGDLNATLFVLGTAVLLFLSLSICVCTPAQCTNVYSTCH